MQRLTSSLIFLEKIVSIPDWESSARLQSRTASYTATVGPGVVLNLKNRRGKIEWRMDGIHFLTISTLRTNWCGLPE